MCDTIRRAVIPGYRGRYEVTDDGHVYDMKRGGREVSPFISRGYCRVNLRRPSGLHEKHSVHRLVAEAFVAGRTAARRWVNHLDGNRRNNLAQNLAWVTPSENTLWMGSALAAAVKNGVAVVAYDAAGRGRGYWCSMAQAARDVGTQKSSISECCSGIRKTAGGLHWRRV